MIRANAGESSTRQLKDTVASTSTIGKEVRQDITCDGDEDDKEDGNSLSKSLLRQDSSLENDVAVEAVSVEDDSSFMGTDAI